MEIYGILRLTGRSHELSNSFAAKLWLSCKDAEASDAFILGLSMQNIACIQVLDGGLAEG